MRRESPTPLPASLEGSDSDSADSSDTLTPPRRTPSPEGNDPEVNFKMPPQVSSKAASLDPSLP